MTPPMTFGKHRGKCIYEVAAEDPRWMAWACFTSQFRKFLAANDLAVRIVMLEPAGETIAEVIEL